jgi:hypothetical protein
MFVCGVAMPPFPNALFGEHPGPDSHTDIAFDADIEAIFICYAEHVGHEELEAVVCSLTFALNE